MIALIISILMTFLMYLNFRLLPIFKVPTFQAIVFNYFFCCITCLVFEPAAISQISFDFVPKWIYLASLLGVLFVIIFYATGKTTQYSGLTVATLAAKTSLIIPVFFSIFILKTGNLNLKNIASLLLCLVSVILSSINPAKGSHSENNKSKFTFLLPLLVFFGCGLTDSLSNLVSNLYINEENTAFFTLFVFGTAATTGFLYLLYKFIRKTESFNYKSVLAGVTIGVPNFFSYYFLIEALREFNNDGSFVYPVSNLGVICISVLVSRFAFKDALTNLNWFGTGLSIIGIIILLT